MIRAFIAARIPSNAALRKLHAQLSQLGEPFRPVAVDKLHVTLKFLGDTEEGQVAAIGEIVKRSASQQPAEEVRLSGLGAFPHARRPSVIWVGMQNANSLTAIAAALDDELADLGFAPEQRPFQPHLTVMRVKARPPEMLFSMLTTNANTEYGTARIESIELFQSELARGGSRYTTLATASLKRD
jgi:2'-5' RNA ligase